MRTNNNNNNSSFAPNHPSTIIPIADPQPSKMNQSNSISCTLSSKDVNYKSNFHNFQILNAFPPSFSSFRAHNTISNQSYQTIDPSQKQQQYTYEQSNSQYQLLQPSNFSNSKSRIFKSNTQSQGSNNGNFVFNSHPSKEFYNPLLDKHLEAFFLSKGVKQQLRHNKLIDKQGRIIETQFLKGLKDPPIAVGQQIHQRDSISASRSRFRDTTDSWRQQLHSSMVEPSQTINSATKQSIQPFSQRNDLQQNQNTSGIILQTDRATHRSRITSRSINNNNLFHSKSSKIHGNSGEDISFKTTAMLYLKGNRQFYRPSTSRQSYQRQSSQSNMNQLQPDNKIRVIHTAAPDQQRRQYHDQQIAEKTLSHQQLNGFITEKINQVKQPHEEIAQSQQ